MTARRPAAPRSTTEAFFRSVAERGREPLLKSASGAIRFDLEADGRVEHWFVTIHEGDVDVRRADRSADAVAHLDRATFERMATGAVNATAAVLRGELQVEGDLGLVLLFQRLFGAGPPGPGLHSSAA